MAIELPTDVIERLKALSFRVPHDESVQDFDAKVVFADASHAYDAGKLDGKTELSVDILKAIGILVDIDVEEDGTPDNEEE